jgi:hypothetical protein
VGRSFILDNWLGHGCQPSCRVGIILSQESDFVSMLYTYGMAGYKVLGEREYLSSFVFALNHYIMKIEGLYFCIHKELKKNKFCIE